MSSKLIATFLMLYFIGVLLSGVVEGGGGIVATSLTNDISATATTLNVSNTEGFLSSDYVVIGSERMRYTSRTATTFTVPANGRGWDGTTAVAHSAGEGVYSPGVSTLNAALGFNVASTGASVGSISIPTAAKTFIFTTIPRLITWNFAWLKEGWLVYLRYTLIIPSAAFALYMAYAVASTLGGILQGIFLRR